MNKLINFFTLIIKTKFNFFLPKKTNILVYDKECSLFANAIFKKNQYITFDTRLESININILVRTIFTKGFSNLFLEYKKLFFKLVSPKIVYTAIDNNPGFYKLKYIYNDAIYISDQNGMRDNIFLNYCKKYNKENKQMKLKCDYTFVFGKNYKKKLNKIIESTLIIGGNTLNNHYPHLKIKKNKTILFVSSGYTEKYLKKDLQVFMYLAHFSKIYNYKLAFLTRSGKNMREIVSKSIPNYKFKIIESNNRKNTYAILSKYKTCVFHHSTLGYEALARGIRCVCFGHNLFKNHSEKYKNKGPFWSPVESFHDLKTLFQKVERYSDNKWKKISKYYSNEILYYDPGNKQKYIIIDRFIRNK